MDTINRTEDVLDARYAAHDLRHLIGLVRGHAEVLSLAAADETTQSGLSEIISAADRITDLFNDLLEFSRRSAPGPAAGVELSQTEQVEVGPLLEEVGRLCAGRAAAAGIEFQVEVAEDLPTLPAVASELRRALVNLVCNALGAVPSEGGQVRLLAEVEPHGIRFSVEDNGPGLPSEYLGELTALAPGGGGQWRRDDDGKLHGLGLVIAALVARRHRGQLIGDRHSSGAGAAMRLRIPATDPESE